MKKIALTLSILISLSLAIWWLLPWHYLTITVRGSKVRLRTMHCTSGHAEQFRCYCYVTHYPIDTSCYNGCQAEKEAREMFPYLEFDANRQAETSVRLTAETTDQHSECTSLSVLYNRTENGWAASSGVGLSFRPRR